jgi:hypothetical protein
MKKKFTKTNENGEDLSAASFLNRSITSQSPSPKKPMKTKKQAETKKAGDKENSRPDEAKAKAKKEDNDNDVVLMDEENEANDENAAAPQLEKKTKPAKSLYEYLIYFNFEIVA